MGEGEDDGKKEESQRKKRDLRQLMGEEKEEKEEKSVNINGKRSLNGKMSVKIKPHCH